jgi:hypothetical protein
MTEQHKTRKRAMSVFPRVTVPDGNSVPGDNKQGVSINTSNPQKCWQRLNKAARGSVSAQKRAHTALDKEEGYYPFDRGNEGDWDRVRFKNQIEETATVGVVVELGWRSKRNRISELNHLLVSGSVREREMMSVRRWPRSGRQEARRAPIGWGRGGWGQVGVGCRQKEKEKGDCFFWSLRHQGEKETDQRRGENRGRAYHRERERRAKVEEGDLIEWDEMSGFYWGEGWEERGSFLVWVAREEGRGKKEEKRKSPAGGEKERERKMELIDVIGWVERGDGWEIVRERENWLGFTTTSDWLFKWPHERPRLTLALVCVYIYILFLFLFLFVINPKIINFV